jgi:hypothetical protein
MTEPLDPYKFDAEQAARVDREEEDGQAFLDAIARGDPLPVEGPRDDMPFTSEEEPNP